VYGKHVPKIRARPAPFNVLHWVLQAEHHLGTAPHQQGTDLLTQGLAGQRAQFPPSDKGEYLLSNNIDSPAVNDVGADISKGDFVAAIDVAGGDIHKLPSKAFARSQQGAQMFLAWCTKVLGENRRVRVIMEATGLYSEQLADWLLELDPCCQVVISNPRIASDFIKSHTDTKTDASDARGLARLGNGRKLHPYIAVSAEQKALRLLVRERKRVVVLLKAEKLRRQEYDAILEQVTAIQDERIAHLKADKATLEKAIGQHINSDNELQKVAKLYMQICGIGLVVAATLLAELGDLGRFSNHRDLVSFLGLKPREYSSGTSVKKRTRMSKRGSGYIRSLLYMAAMTTIRRENRFQRQYTKLIARGKNGKAALGAVMRKMVVVLRAMAITGKPYHDTHQPSCGKAVNTCGESLAA
jgi:transposase